MFKGFWPGFYLSDGLMSRAVVSTLWPNRLPFGPSKFSAFQGFKYLKPRGSLLANNGEVYYPYISFEPHFWKKYG